MVGVVAWGAGGLGSGVSSAAVLVMVSMRVWMLVMGGGCGGNGEYQAQGDGGRKSADGLGWVGGWHRLVLSCWWGQFSDRNHE